MNRFKSALCATLAMTFAAGSAVPLAAAPLAVPATPQASSDILHVQNRWESRQDRRERQFDSRQDRREREFDRRQDRREARFERRNGVPYYHGHRGYDRPRPGYRQYNGFWFPPAAFIAGAIIGGAIANQPAVAPRGTGNAHVQWCYDRYRSYRASDNTFQPNNGPRKACISPYS